MTQNTTLTNLSMNLTDASDLISVDRAVLARLDLDTITAHDLATWLRDHGAAHLSQIERIELAERLNRRRFIIGAGGLLGAAALGACGAVEEADAPTATIRAVRTVTDDLDRHVEVPATPQRIVVMGQQFIELAVALDVALVGAAVTGFEPEGAILDRLPYLDRDVPGAPQVLSFVDINIEAVTALAPDLIVVPPVRIPTYDVLPDIAPTLYYNPSTDWRSSLHKFAEAVGRTTQAKQVIEYYDADVAGWREEVAPLVEQAPQVTLALLHTEGQAFVMNEDAPAGRVLGSLGFCVVVPEGVQVPENGVAPMSVESLADLTADVIITTGATGPLDFDHPGLPILESLDTPVGRAPLPEGIGNAGPYSDRIFIEVFVEAICSVLT